MKTEIQKMRVITWLFAIALFSSCQFNQSVNRDLKTGAYFRGDGIGVSSVAIVVNGVADNRNEFAFGDTINLLFDNVSGLTDYNGKTFPELSIFIVKNGNDTVLSNPHLFKKISEGTDLSPLQLQVHFSAALPNQNNEKYKVFVEITDKKGDGKLNYELPFTVKEYDLLNVQSSGIEFSTIYLWNETLKKPVFDNNLSAEHHYFLLLNDIAGLEIKNEKIFPILSLKLTDKNGNELLSNPNVLSAHEEVGVDPIDVKSQITASLKFSKEKINNPCKFTAKLKDKNSKKIVVITSELNIK
jgi:hypothetical protein